MQQKKILKNLLIYNLFFTLLLISSGVFASAGIYSVKSMGIFEKVKIFAEINGISFPTPPVQHCNNGPIFFEMDKDYEILSGEIQSFTLHNLDSRHFREYREAERLLAPFKSSYMKKIDIDVIPPEYLEMTRKNPGDGIIVKNTELNQWELHVSGIEMRKEFESSQFIFILQDQNATGDILTLSDGNPKVLKWNPLSNSLTNISTQLLKKIYHTDYSIPEELQGKESKDDPRVTYLKVDNTKDLPTIIKQRKYDFISFKRGLCLCESIKNTCGGISCSIQEERNDIEHAVNFILRVGNVLNTQNPRAVGLLHGSVGNETPSRKKYWAEVIEAVNLRDHDFTAKMILDPSGNFYAIKIVPLELKLSKYRCCTIL